MDISALSTADEEAVYLVAKASAEADTPDVPPWSRAAFLARIHDPWPGHNFEFHVAHDDDGQVAGYVELGLPQLDNLSNVNLQVTVHPDRRRKGIGRALYTLAVERARAHGRSHLIGPTVDRRPDGPAFATAMGARAGLAELRSRLDVADFDILNLDVPIADGYRLVQWTDHAPDDLIDDVALLDSSLMTEAPSGDLNWEAEKIDAARVRESEAAIVARNRTGYSSAAVHIGTGRLIAWTQITCPNDDRWQAWQQITIVDPTHRGHGLGLTIKVANLRYARSTRPELRAIDTFNAADNAAMLRVNEAMGFQRRETWSQWQVTV
ncbi:GNAT family N-acetyltransferase [Winogradskya humida]|uniref:N-acetyltransferase n=1 Tax=Winogradskya humida TaxID=113566 RepID=A0ABQ3ZQN4_9ACTN|nr:GNAT family N-acetyltransferase [Actinoplanes humidus]GIE20890.1 N-acetyltransferase [Actinoplanes humidus]